VTFHSYPPVHCQAGFGAVPVVLQPCSFSLLYRLSETEMCEKMHTTSNDDFFRALTIFARQQKGPEVSMWCGMVVITCKV